MKKKIPTKKDFSCGGLVWDEAQKQLLMVQVENLAHKIVWTFPKGHPEKGETDEQAALREVLEETGWACEITKKLEDISYFYQRDGVRYHKTVRWFLMKPQAKEGSFMEHEIRDVRWATPAEAKGLVVYETDKKLLSYFL